MFANLREMWDEAGAGARLGLATGVLLILALVAWFSFNVLSPEYQTLFSDLDPQDASTMVAELEKMKVPYRLAADGTAIMVDKSQVHALRLKLLGKGGTLRGGVGFEIFNNTDFGMTEFAQKINYQRALQGELTRTISALDEVKSVRVHLVMPESGLFRKSGTKPKASITLAMKDGRTLAPDQVLGIQRLVAAAVPEIEPSAVTIADQRGVTLTRAGGGDGEDATSARLGVKSDVEAYITRKLVAVFDRAFGPGRVIVSVDATINHDQVKVTREDVLPLGTRGGEAVGAVARSRTTQSEPTAGAAGEPAKTGSVGSSSSEIEYLNGRRIEQVVSMPGSIKRLSVGIILPKAMDKARLEEIRQLVATTVGINPSRGDEIAISSLEQAPNAARTDADAATKPALEPLPAETVPNGETMRRGITSIFAPHPEWLLGAVAVLMLLLGLAWIAGRSGRNATGASADAGSARGSAAAGANLDPARAAVTWRRNTAMNDGDRRAALEMHALGQRDREWVLGRLDPNERARIEPLLSELDALDIRFDLDPAQLAGGAIASVPLHREPAPGAAAGAIAVVRSASAGAVISALESEPQWLIDSVLAIEAWPWSPAVRAAFAGRGSRDTGLRMREPSSSPMRGPALNAALVEQLAGRLQALAPGMRLNGHRNGHDHAHDPQSRWSRVVSGVRQWLP